ncbi:MAG: hypothetical protein M3247_05100 [Thermoproteota archaeon]|nr:hypothetical protein [Thermoproteota archaeon]
METNLRASNGSISEVTDNRIDFGLVYFSGMLLALIESAFAYNISAAGHWACNDNAKRTVSILVLLNPEQLFELGDYSYASTADCWLAILGPNRRKNENNYGQPRR